MNFRSEKGFTGTDITVAILIVTIFTSIIAVLFYNYSVSAKDIEKKQQATEYAVSIIEEIKNNSSTYFEGDYATMDVMKVTSTGIKGEDEDVSPEEIGDSKFYKTITITDYAALPENEGKGYKKGYVKKVDVVVEYQSSVDRKVELSTAISKD